MSALDVCPGCRASEAWTPLRRFLWATRLYTSSLVMAVIGTALFALVLSERGSDQAVATTLGSVALGIGLIGLAHYLGEVLRWYQDHRKEQRLVLTMTGDDLAQEWGAYWRVVEPYLRTLTPEQHEVVHGLMLGSDLTLAELMESARHLAP